MNDQKMSPSMEAREQGEEMDFDEQTQAKIAEIEDAILELTDLCESHDELMTVLRIAIAYKRRENEVFAALDGMDEAGIVAMIAKNGSGM